PGREERACLNYHINRCLAPCIGAVSQEAYHDVIHQIIMFLEGRQEEVEKKLEKAMNEASEALAFERAAAYRDRLQAVRKVIEKQKIVSTAMEDLDVIASASERTFSIVQVFQIRGGKLIGREHFLMTEGSETTQEELTQAFISQYYSEVALIPRTILIPCHFEGEETVAEWLRSLRKGAINLSVPQRGEKKELMHLAQENAAELLSQARIQREQQERENGQALEDLQKILGLGVRPDRIEAYDISNFQGNETVASMVVFEDGIARPDQYRKFRIRTVEGPNDFASMQEVVGRRFKRGLEERNDAVLALEGKFARFPNLVVIDGGKGQLSAARAVMEELGLGHLETLGLAEREEEVFRPGISEPYILPRDSAALHLLQQVRDEAHRFAITYHRKLRDKRTTQSLLDTVPGIGPTRKKALIKKFGSLRGVRQATVEELQEVPGISRDLAETIKDIVGAK
ncbi:MAG TPA: excinuclease ABC subunit C, partial [Firmicutes bacterium]|nr:excinuclease ABC subunit C [Bacillota bacterium]HBR24338.1 excinuclease ABC subunit C [Bacillota bacterium]